MFHLHVHLHVRHKARFAAPSGKTSGFADLFRLFVPVVTVFPAFLYVMFALLMVVLAVLI